MEEVLDVYMLPEDPDVPLVCMDEASKQLVGETRAPLPARPGDNAHEDYEYVRNGVANLFMFFAPLQGWRHVEVTERRTKVDCAYALRDLVDVYFPTARTIRVVFDNLNTHAAGSLYEAFPPEEARRILDRLELHHTPKHGSWLNMAEIERERARPAMPGPAHPRPGTAQARDRGVGGAAQQRPRHHGVALHDGRRAHQTQASLPCAHRAGGARRDNTAASPRHRPGRLTRLSP
jgi:hypothetical protein